jgi:hypothetical protein
MDERPPPLLIENVDDRAISLVQLITKLYGYTIGLRDLIYEIEDREGSDNAHLYFSGLSGAKRRDPKDVDALFRVHVSSDIVKGGGEARRISTILLITTSEKTISTISNSIYFLLLLTLLIDTSLVFLNAFAMQKQKDFHPLEGTAREGDQAVALAALRATCSWRAF